jgi:SAM-dependent methyltransferase
MEPAASDWYLDETFWAALYPLEFTPSSYAAAAEQVGHILTLTGCPSGAVLDLACGAGRHSIPFAQRGFAVTAVDRTPWLLSQARAHAASANVQIEWVQEDMRQFVRPRAFGLIVNLFTSFGYFDRPEENRQVLQNVHESLTAGGVFLLDLIGKEIVARTFQPTSAQEIPGTGLLVQRRNVSQDWSRIENEWLLISAGAVRTFRFRHWLYSGSELQQLLASVGFSTVRLYGNLEGAPYGPGASRLIAVAGKSVG